MKYLLFALSAVTLALAVACFLSAQSAVHEILGGVLCVVFAVFLSAAALLDKLDALALGQKPAASAEADTPRGGFIRGPGAATAPE